MSYPTISSQTSGIINVQQLLVSDVIRRAYSMAGITEGSETPQMLTQAKQRLNLVLQNLLNKGLPLFSTTQYIMGFTPGIVQYNLPESTYDVLDCVWRTTTPLQYTCTGGVDPQYLTAANYFAYAYTEDNFIASFELNGAPEYMNQQGLFFFGAQEVTLTFFYSTDGTNYIQFDSYPKTSYVDGEWLWVQYPQGVTAYYIKVAVGTDEILSLRAWYLTNLITAVDLPIARVNRDAYQSYPVKLQQGSPVLYYFERTLIPTISVWGQPNSSYNWQLYLRLKTQLQDCGALTNTLQAPPWYLDSIIVTLAKDLCLEANAKENMMERYDILKKESEQKIAEAKVANNDRGPISLVPNFQCYTL